MKVLLIDDHPLILTALESVIRGLGDDVTVVGVDSAGAARAALKKDAEFDLVLLDLSLGDADGFEVLTEFRNAYPALPVVDTGSFRATQPGFDQATARAEASRCFRCDAVYGCPAVSVVAGRGPADSRTGPPAHAHTPLPATSAAHATPTTPGGAQ